jgi:hypothetical protein
MNKTKRDEDLGFYALKKGDFQEAVNIFRRALDEKKTGRAYLGFGLAHEGLEDLPTARWAYYKSLDLDPQSRELQQRIGAVDRRMARTATVHAKRRSVSFRALHHVFERRGGGGWQPFFVKAINLGLGLPGYFPGEYAIKKKTYRVWFEQMHALGFNAVRIYTLHPPAFYEALDEFNKKSTRLFLLQGIWAELPNGNDFNHESYLHYIKRQIMEAVDVIFGNASLQERPGYPHGTYSCDLSPYTMGFIFGREWESCPVAAFNDMQGRQPADYDGSFLRMIGGSPFEIWIAQMADFLLRHESERYGVTHPLSAVTWPTLDPLTHPSESRYEDNLRRQGWQVRAEGCNENEDVESLDQVKIETKGGSGFFATYHVYPYYPEFMNNDYVDEKEPYLAYLSLLKKHHGKQPVIVAEFGVPSSREVSHWHIGGWHHGGHDEVQQGKINGEMMLTIHRAGLAGGALFSWFDEWFKRNWLFIDYELPPDRNAFWFNFQDAEQNYGLIGAYPGYPRKKVSLSGRRTEWTEETTLYRKETGPINAFSDGLDNARTLRQFAAMVDEGFLYLLLETDASVDFSAAHYLIALDTCEPLAGEFALPFGLKPHSPTGLKFIIHLAGQNRSRILVCKSYDKFLNAGSQRITPGRSFEGAWVMMQNRTNDRHISKDGKRFFPPRVSSMSALRHGSLDQRHAAYNSLADFLVSGNLMEIRIPWGLIQFTDPSSKTVLWEYETLTTRKTDGIRMYALSYKPSGKGFTPSATQDATGIADALPASLERHHIRTFTWESWNTPLYHTYEKPSAQIYKKYLQSIKT